MSHRDPDMLVDLTNAASPFEAEIIRSKLVDAGVEAFAFTAPGWADPMSFGSTQPYRVQVRRKDLEAAAAILKEHAPRSDSVDWDAEDLGDAPADEPAAASAGDPEWAEKHERKKTTGQTFVLIAGIPAFGFAGVLAFVVGVVRKLRGKDLSRD